MNFLKKTLIFLSFIFTTSVHGFAPDINLDFENYKQYVTTTNGLIALGSACVAFGLLKVIILVNKKAHEFWALVNIERAKQKIRDERYKRKYKIAHYLGNPAVRVLDKYYATKTAYGKKLVEKMLARKVVKLLYSPSE